MELILFLFCTHSRGWGYCLEDEPAKYRDTDYDYPVLPPGIMYDVDHQCRLTYGPNSSFCGEQVHTVLPCVRNMKIVPTIHLPVEKIIDKNIYDTLGLFLTSLLMQLFLSKGGHLHHIVVSVGEQVHDPAGGGC